MKKLFLLFSLVLITSLVLSQSSNELRYYMEAKAYRFTDDGSFLMIAMQYPALKAGITEKTEEINVFMKPPSLMVNRILSKEQLEKAVVIADVPFIQSNALMSDRQMMELLQARMGLTAKELKDTNYTFHHRYVRASFVNDTVDSIQVLNLETITDVHQSDSKRIKSETSSTSYHVLDATPITLATLGGKKAIECVSAIILEADLSHLACYSNQMISNWIETIDCDAAVSEYGIDEIYLRIDPNELGCETPQNKPFEVRIPKEGCFRKDQPCK